MKFLKLIGLTAIFITLAASQSVMAADGEGITTTFGIRAWSAEWAGNADGGLVSNGSGAVTSIAEAKSNATTAIIPFVVVRYGDLGLSSSVMLRKRFTLEGSNISLTPERQEWDVSGLYYFAPGASASIGYKKMTWDNVAIKGPIVTISGSAPFLGNVGMYGTAAVGWMKTNVDKSSNFASGASTAYNLLEGGLSYSFGPMVMLKGTAVTFGYRMQRIKAKNLWPIISTNGPIRYRDTIDSMSGPVLGFQAAF